MLIIQIVFFLILAVVGAYVGMFLRLPAGAIMGSMIFVILAKFFGILDLPPTKLISFSIQVLLGLNLGLTLTKINKTQLKRLSGALVVIFCGVLLMTFLTGLIIAYVTHLNIKTVFLSSVPGGMAEMSILAQELNLQASVVAILHTLRLLIVLAIFPFILKLVVKRLNSRKEKGSTVEYMD